MRTGKKLVYDSADKNMQQEDMFQWEFTPDTATEIQITRAESEDILHVQVNRDLNCIQCRPGELKAGDETFKTEAGIRDFSLHFLMT